MLDAPTFDRDAFINAMLPGPDALGDLGTRVTEIERQCAALDADIRSGIREAACSRVRTRTALHDTQEVVSDLFKKIASISSKSESSQQQVADICRDIRTLDIAKKNLSRTILALKQLHMMSMSVAQLRSKTAERDFKEAANLLKAYHDVANLFASYANVGKLSDLNKKAAECRESLRAAVFEAFGAAGAGSLENQRVLADACSVVSVLGPECRSSLIDSVVRRTLEPYRSVFTPSEISGSAPVEDARLENVDRRYEWFRLQSKNFRERFKGVFPESWNVPGLLAQEFCSLTSQHLKTLLKAESIGDNIEVSVLVRILTKTISFERDMQRSFGADSNNNHGVEPEALSEVVDDSDDRRESTTSAGRSGTQQKDSSPGQVKLNFRNSISSCFQPFMGCYVTLEKQNMAEWVTRTIVLPCLVTSSCQRYKGSDQIFLYIKTSMKRCIRLDQPQILLDVHEVYCAGLQGYCKVLESHVPVLSKRAPEAPAIPGAGAIPVVAPTVPDLTTAQLQSLGVLINTAEYCSETLPQLQESISKQIGQDVDLGHVQESFDSLINMAIEEVVTVTAAQADKILASMSKLPLATMDAVGDTSSYVQQLRSQFNEKVSTLSSVISPVYHHFFCSRLVATFLPKYLLTILRCKRINDFGAQQLLLDTEALKTVLLNLPSLGSDKQATLEAEKKRAPKAYATVLIKQLGKTEAILKTISATPDTLAETFSTLCPSANQADLSRIMDLKGMKKSDQQPVLKAYNALCPVATQAEPIIKDLDSTKKFYIF
ncbi:hypothetical protein PBRA_006290 [Plasmodiophora brassicae]|uniref:Uncharacterized protein n=1 Tax=Plasmodiophora brassicae TaxID=37360 RepID=A0A0G4ISV3_PLABS|nr:hypothetical protein PBRA_006290 [Plasmodiophora brassicae]